ncbi:MAG: efflux RND transporter periplasmic adaptor subunit [Cyclobacteriaceae bacterium]|nr:efflux RND transporter periplasmic adaptor subunit [Cyclobacteriaceae bacterium]
MKNIFQSKYFIIAITLIIGITIGWLVSPSSQQQINSPSHQHISQSEVWTCSMHPQIRQSEAGQCPICGMDLIPLGNEDDGGDPMEVKMSETAMKLANVQTTVVGMGNSVKEVRLNGKVQADERLVTSQTSHLPGRVESLLINFTGDYVRKGETIGKIYSPELVTAQQELLEANKIKDTQPDLFEAAKAKLKNWKLMDSQIEKILQDGKPMTEFPIHSNFSGIVLSKNISVGDHVMQGQSIYEVVDLSRVWILFDVYESDIQWIKTNNEIEFTIKSLPGETFRKKISFIDPIINPQTRVASARVEMPNPDLRLKPEMFASAVVKSEMKGGKEIILPKSAVMWTGERSVVYVKKTSDAGVSFRMTEVTLGPALGDAYVIKEGLTAGQEVVTNGTFTIDAAAQLAGKPSMMSSPAGGGTEIIEAPNENQLGVKFDVDNTFKNQLRELLNPYLAMKDALVKTNAAEASKISNAFINKLSEVDRKLVKGEAHDSWMKLLQNMKIAATLIQSTENIENQRKSFSDLSNSYYAAIDEFAITGLHAYYQYCPMANENKGAYWISQVKEIQNPYFGSKMMRCGETKSELK